MWLQKKERSNLKKKTLTLIKPSVGHNNNALSLIIHPYACYNALTCTSIIYIQHKDSVGIKYCHPQSFHTNELMNKAIHRRTQVSILIHSTINPIHTIMGGGTARQSIIHTTCIITHIGICLSTYNVHSPSNYSSTQPIGCQVIYSPLYIHNSIRYLSNSETRIHKVQSTDKI